MIQLPKLSFLLAAAVCCAQPAQRVRLVVQAGSASVHQLAISPDGRFALTAEHDTTARLWDLASGRELRRLAGHAAWVSSVAFSADGRLALTGSGDRTLRLWRPASGQELRRLRGPSAFVNSVAFVPGGDRVFAGDDAGIAWLWNVYGQQEERRFEGHTGSIESVACAPNGLLALTGGRDRTVRLWGLNTGKEVRRLEGETDEVWTVAFSADGRLAMAGGKDPTVRIWDVASGREVQHLAGHTDAVKTAAFSPDGKMALTGSNDRTVRLWDLATGREVRRFEGWQAVFSPNGKYILGSADGVRLWETGTGKELVRLASHSDWIDSVAMAADGLGAITAGGNTAKLWSFVSGREERQLSGHSGRIWSVALSPDGRWALTGSEDQTARLWEVSRGREVRRFAGHTAAVTSVAFSPDSRVALTGSRDHTVRLWDVASGRELWQRTHTSEIASVSFSPAGRLVLAIGWDDVRLWETESGKQTCRLSDPAMMTSGAFLPAGEHLITGDAEGHIELWDARTGKKKERGRAVDGSIDAIAFSPDGHIAAMGGFDATLRVGDIGGNSGMHELQGHQSAVRSLAFSPDSRLLLSGSFDGTARLWDVRAGRDLATLVSFDDGTWAVTDREGRYDASDPDNAVGMHWVAGDEVIELGQLKHRFYTPALLARVVKGETLPAIPAGIQSIPVPPAIQAGAPARNAHSVSATLSDRGGGIGRVLARINGREVPVEVNGTQVTIPLDPQIARPEGDNLIEIRAFDGQGLIASRGVSVTWKTPERVQDAHIYAIVAGASEYAISSLRLRFAAKDAADMAHALELAAAGLVGPDKTEVRLLATGTAMSPSKQNLRAAFAEVARKARPADVLVVYLAGHGVTLAGVADRYFYLTPDARSAVLPINDKAMLDLMSVSSEELRDWCLRIPALKQVIILDTCAAGAANSDLMQLASRRDVTPDQRRALELLKDATGSHVLMGAAADAPSYEAGRYGQGLLTYAVLSGLRGAALDEGGRVDVRRLFDFAQHDVEELARGIGGIQRPQVSSPQGSTFPIGLLTEEKRRRIQIAKAKPQLLRLRCEDDNGLDPMKLEPLLRAALRDASAPATRGAAGTEPPVVYLDTVVEGVPDALIPQVRYTVDGQVLHLRLRLIREGKPAWEQNVDTPSADARSVASVALEKILSAAKGL